MPGIVGGDGQPEPPQEQSRNSAAISSMSRNCRVVWPPLLVLAGIGIYG